MKYCEETRERVIAFLLFLTSRNCFEMLGKFVAPEKLGYELCRIWFDEIYAPGTRYLETLKGDYCAEETRRFEACFEVEELVELERFHRFFELRLEMLSRLQPEAGAFPQNQSWQNLIKHAAYLVEELEPGAAQRRQQLEKNVALIIKERGQLPPPAHWRILMAGDRRT